MKGTIKGACALITLASLTGAALAGAENGTLYAVDSSRALFTVDMATGVKTPIGTVSANAGTTGGLAYNAATQTMYLTSTSLDSLYTLDVNTGTATLIGPYGDAALVMHGLEWNSANNTLYGASSHNGGLYTINTATGAATLIGTNGLTSFSNLVFASNSNTMYGTNSSTDRFYAVDLSTGAFTPVSGGLIGGSTNPNSMAFSTATNTIYMADNSTDNLYTIDPATGVGTVVGSMGVGNILGLAYVPGGTNITVSGNLSLLDTVPGPGYSRTIFVEIEFGTQTFSTNANIAGNGTYSISVPANLTGAARMRADGSSFLRTLTTVNLTGANVTKNLSLRNGDVDNSGEVDAADIDDIIAAFGSTGTPVTDVDMSGEVDAADIDIVIANFGLTDE